jgi:UDP-N-acetylglucosamine/UDP-N-acetylgalactosamine diphosphorylase
MEIDPSILHRLTNADQTHLISYWDQLDHEQRAILVRDITNTDFDHINQAFGDIKDQLTDQTTSNGPTEHTSIDDLMEPVPEHQSGSVDKTSKEQLELYRRQGLKAIAEGSVCVLLLAGGQGTRLGRTDSRLLSC